MLFEIASLVVEDVAEQVFREVVGILVCDAPEIAVHEIAEMIILKIPFASEIVEDDAILFDRF